MCSICNHSVPLESAKSDEYGRPVHEKCYVLQTRLRLESAHRRPRREEFDRLLRIFISEFNCAYNKQRKPLLRGVLL
jgi:hypothetical protein